MKPGARRPPGGEGAGRDPIAKFAAGLRELSVAMIPVQAAAAALVDDLMELLPETPGLAGEPGWVRCHPGPPRVLAFAFWDGPPRLDVHWGSWPGLSSYAVVRDRWRRIVTATLEEACRKGLSLPTRPFGPSAAFFAFHFASARLRDVDNYTVRFIVNALRHAGILGEDSFDRLSVAVRAYPDGPLRTELVLVEDIGLPFRMLEETGPFRQVLAEMQAAVARAGNRAG